MDFSQLFNLNSNPLPETDSEGEDTEEYEGEDLTLPPLRFEKLEVNGEDFDLRDPTQAQQAFEKTIKCRQELRSGDLTEYEGKSLELWHGGRSRLFADELRSKLACDFHEGKHTLTWEQQAVEADRIQEIRAAKLRAQGL